MCATSHTQVSGTVWKTMEQHKRENDKLKAQAAQMQAELQMLLAKRSKLEIQKREDEAAIARASRRVQELERENTQMGTQLESALSIAQAR